MRYALFIGLIAVPVVAQEPGPTLDSAYIEKMWGLKATIKSSSNQKRVEFVLLIVHTKDLKDEELRTVKKCFDYPFPQKEPLIEALFFDDDNVPFAKSGILGKIGEVTGVKGDAIRITVASDQGPLSRIKRIAIRPATK